MESSNKSVLITGAGGFIGSHIVKKFHKEGFSVIAVIHKNLPEELLNLGNIEFIYADINKADSFYDIIKDYKPSIIVHTAGIVRDIGREKEFEQCNFEPIKTLIKIDFDKLIYISSTDVYGLKDFYGADERTRLDRHPENPYQKYKIKTEKWIENNLPYNKYIIIRPAAVWGENDKTIETRFVNYLKNSKYIVHFGKWRGKNRWPLANVKSVANAVYKSAITDKFNGDAINIIDSDYTTLDEYFSELCRKYFPNKTFKRIYLPLWFGKLLGFISTTVSNWLNLKSPIFEPTAYSIKHLTSNLDFQGKQFSRLLLSSLNKD